MDMPRTALVVVDHGSRLPESGTVLLRVVEAIRATGRYHFVAGAHMDLEQPSLHAALETCFSQGAERVVIVPFMLAPGRHSSEDIPRLAREAFPQAPEGQILVAQPLGDHPGVIQAVLDAAEGATGSCSPPALLRVETSALLAIDLQSSLLTHIERNEQIVASARFLIESAAKLGVSIHVSEQYPRGLGRTDPRILQVLPESLQVVEKMEFGCFACAEFAQRIPPHCRQLVICGVEAHVCVTQTVLQALHRGYQVYVVTDAIGSRHWMDYQTSLRRLSRMVHMVSAEMVVYEWLQQAGTERFQSLRPLLKRGTSPV